MSPGRVLIPRFSFDIEKIAWAVVKLTLIMWVFGIALGAAAMYFWTSFT